MRRALLLLLLTILPAAVPGSYEPIKQQAEGAYAEKSFSRAHELYVQASKLLLPDEEKRWVAMRVADTAWRADRGQWQEAIKGLEAIVGNDEHDRVWAEANESLGDLHLTIDQSLGNAQRYYEAALGWWASSSDIAYARRRYLDIVFRMSEQRGGYYRSGWAYMQPGVSRDVLVNALAIAQTDEERAHARYLLGVSLINDAKPESIERGLELLDQVIQQGKATQWLDDALFASALRFAQGVPVVDDKGEIAYKQDFTKALALYRRIVNEFARADTPYYSEATTAIMQIESPSVALMVGSTFLPTSEQEVVLSWRNVKAVSLSVTAVNLVNDSEAVRDRKDRLWGNNLDVGRYGPIRQWTYTTSDQGDHVPGNARVRITPKLPVGAYVIDASSGGERSRQLLLVTDATIVVHSADRRSDVLVCDAVTSRPIADAHVRAWQWDMRGEKVNIANAQTDANGYASLTFGEPVGGAVAIAASASENRQATAVTWTYGGNPQAFADWRVYAFTDRPAYRPGDIVHWKVIARARQNEQWITPANQTLDYEITGPRGDRVASGAAKFSEFGTYWADLTLNDAMPLGLYNIRFSRRDAAPYTRYGYAQLFRLEEYKLPEFRVSVKTPDNKQYRTGETVEATIEAEYYFGGPVANAEVEAVVEARPLVHYWYAWRDYPWYYEQNAYRGGGREIKNETLHTDASGRATIRIETTPDDADTVLAISAHVTDASRREVDSEGVVNVTQHRYSVVALPDHYLLRPGDKASVQFKTFDANEKPVQVTGTVKVVRQRWTRDRYAEEEVLTSQITTNEKGEATYSFTATREGYYAVRWSSEDRDAAKPRRARDVVKVETALWITDRATEDLGYHANGLEVILDNETLRPGDTATAMVVTPSSGRSVLLTTSGDGILDSQVLRLDGTAKLVRIPLDDRHTPVFFLTATSVFDRQLSNIVRPIVVPPVAHFINVDVKADRSEYEPRQKGSLLVTTRDVDGRPVHAEVALAVSDESVTAIQSELAGDPRQFFFGAMRANRVSVAASVQQRYVNLVEDHGKLVDDKQRDAEKKDDQNVRDIAMDRMESRRVGGGVVGGVIGVVAKSMAAPQNMAVAEAITVTAAAPVVSLPPPPAPPPPGRTIEVQVRHDFRATAFWQPNVITGADGTARVGVDFPESLTTWRATARAITATTQVGSGSTTVRTSMPLLVRLQSPRFFVAGDRVTISAVVNNNTDTSMNVKPSIDVAGLALQSNANADVLTVPPHGEARADWTVIAEKQGEAKIRVKVEQSERSGRATAAALHGDAMEKTFTVYEHGVDKLIAKSGKVRDAEMSFKLDLPHERRATSLTIQLQPSLAATMFDALPYLIDFPYGCTEQTMSRFLPAAIVAKTMAANGVDADAIGQRMFGGIERDFAGKTHPKGAKDLNRLDEMTDAGMARLYDFQHGDGGWGWWKNGDSDAFMTAYVVWGFSIAKMAGLEVRDASVRRAVSWLDDQLIRHRDDASMQAWMLHATAAWRAASHDVAVPAPESRAFQNVYDHRDRLTAYSRALLALAAHDYGDSERAMVLARNLENGLKGDHWGEDHLWWRWYESPVESTAFGLQALVRIDPKNPLIEPIMTWLVKNRRGAQWNNTRDTAITILALNDYLKSSGELKAGTTYELTVNGRVIASQRLTDILGAPQRFNIDDVRDSNEIRIRRSGGPLYFAAEGRFISLEEPVKAAGNEIFVRRDYFRLAAKPTLLAGVVYDRLPLLDNGSVKSGERVDVVLTIETKNDYDYLLLEDLKPAGLEAVELQSGASLFAREIKSGRSVWVYQELRDRKIALFIDHLPQGTWEIRYTLRAEVPGAFHALPVLGQAMYVPEIRGNSEEVRMIVADH